VTRRVVAAVAVATSVLLGCGSDVEKAPDSIGLDRALETAEPAGAPFDGLTAVDVTVGGDPLRVVVADEAVERSAGLRDRTDPEPYDGMLFVPDRETTTSFTMRGVDEPLDLAFFDADGERLGGHEMTPCAEGVVCPSYRSEVAWRFALETPAGGMPDGELRARS